MLVLEGLRVPLAWQGRAVLGARVAVASGAACLGIAGAARADESATLPREPTDESLAVVGVSQAIESTRRHLRAGEADTVLDFADTSDWLRTTSGSDSVGAAAIKLT